MSIRLLGFTVLLSLFTAPASAQRLGTIHFPTSGAGAAQAAFERGVLFLHSFEYESAAREFQRARTLDPRFVMAHWGEALTHTHQVWNQQDLPAARAVLARLGATREDRQAKAPTHRERMYLESVEDLYGDGPKAKRDTLYAEALERLVAAHPEDDEAKVFLAVALLGLNQSVRDVPTYMRAGAIAQDVFRRNEDHPGAAHFIIHAFDDPVHAPLGLHAARRYSEIAPEAPHAQHMTTHIFLALGMWDEVVAQNTIASGPARDRWRPGHYTSWLHYGLLQQGRYEDARALLALVHGNMGGARPVHRSYLRTMRAHQVLMTEQWSDPALAWSIDGESSPGSRAIDAFVGGLASLRRGNPQVAQARAADLSAMTDTPVADILSHELRAAIAQATGQTDSALAHAEAASRLEDARPVEFGPPDVVKPSHELRGEILLAAGRPGEAVRAFEAALARGPGRSSTLLLLSRAAREAGLAALAARAAERLAANWHTADPVVRARLAEIHAAP